MDLAHGGAARMHARVCPLSSSYSGWLLRRPWENEWQLSLRGAVRLAGGRGYFRALMYTLAIIGAAAATAAEARLRRGAAPLPPLSGASDLCAYSIHC